MDGRRPETVGPLIAFVAILGAMVVAPVASAAGGCELSAPATVNVGTPLSIVGQGYPPDKDVDVALVIDGGSPDEFVAHSDTLGKFTINLTPETADLGRTTVTASVAGTACTAETVFTVLAPGATAAPAASGTRANAPRTDTIATGQRLDSITPAAAYAMAWLALLLGVGGLLAVRLLGRR